MSRIKKEVEIHTLKKLSLKELIDISNDEASMKEVIPAKYLDHPVESKMVLDQSKPILRGTFKCSTLAELSPKLPCGSSLIVAKQVLGSSGRPLTGQPQLAALADEVTCLMWASAFCNEVSAFVYSKLSARRGDDLPFDIPHFEYVTAALALEIDMNTAQQKRVTAYLIESRISLEAQGTWRKYINNDSPMPLPLEEADDRIRAEFLSFSQHFQYMLTKKLAFVSDFQGE